jgi:RNA polymerase sigma-70 factor (ECF subfamily)
MKRQTEEAERELRSFYAASYPRLVTVVGAISGDREEAEEAVQDAFVRLLGRWDKISRYDDPEAWVRRAALNCLSNRRRKARNGTRAALRHGVEPDVAPPGPEAVDVQRALAALPVEQRAVVVLQQLGMDNNAVAAALGIPAGTVKSRLSRARRALAPLIQEEESRV